MVNLEYIYLQKNQIVSLHKDTFKGLVKLKELYLEENKIKSLEPNTFKDLLNLRELNLERNQIEALREDNFKVMVMLEVLNLQRNGSKFLFHISSNIFHVLPNLKFLYLKGNKIVSLHEDSFKGLKSIKIP